MGKKSRLKIWFLLKFSIKTNTPCFRFVWNVIKGSIRKNCRRNESVPWNQNVRHIHMLLMGSCIYSGPSWVLDPTPYSINGYQFSVK